MNDIKQARGVVEATAQNSEDRYGVRVAGAWYDGRGECPVERGELIEIDYAQDGRHRNIEAMRRAEPAAEEADPGERGPEARIARAVALKAAAELKAGTGAEARAVLEVASEFEKWLRGAPG